MLFVLLILFAKSDVIHMVVHIDIRHVGSLVPLWLSRHIIRNHFTINREVLEADVFHLAALVVTGDDVHVGSFSGVGDVAQGDILDASAWGRTVLLVEANTHVEEHSLADVFDAEVLEGDALYQDVVAIVDADAALIVYLVLGMLQDIDVVIEHVGDVLVLWSLAVQAYHDRMSHVCPHDEILDGNVPATAMIVLAGAVDGRAVVAGTCKEMLLVDVVAGKDVETIAPAIPAHHLGILYGYGIAAADRQLGGERAVDIHVLAVSHHDTLVMARHYDAVTENLYIPRAIGG